MKSPVFILDSHAHANDEMRPLPIAEEELRCELRLGGHVFHRGGEGRARRVDAHLGAGAGYDSLELPLWNEDVDVWVRRVRDCNRWGADGGELAGLRRDVNHLSRLAGAKRVPREQLLLEGKLRLGLVET